ncbi:MAG: aldose 1-epimerase family protein [Planctomycetes bacterium]|nr:aldose 1-epimerase family protein [Planctomycetota bacterium]
MIPFGRTVFDSTDLGVPPAIRKVHRGLSAALTLLVLFCGGSLLAETPLMHQVLTSVKDNVHVDAWQWKSDGAMGVPAGVVIEKKPLHGGKQEGVDLILVDNGVLKFAVVPTRGMAVLEVVRGDIRLGWQSPVKEVVHPQFMNLESRGGLGWLEGFNEWMARCGTEFAGHPGQDKFINNVGDESSVDLTLHGRIGNIPASEVEVTIDRAPPHRIRVRGRVDERCFYGAQLELWTEISTVPGASTFQISDELTNRGGAEQEIQVIYHANHGRPLLEEGAKFVAPLKRVTPFNDRAACDLDHHATYTAPTPGFVEQVYCIVPYADAEGRTLVMLRNAAGDKGVSFQYRLDQLPYLTQWKNTLSEANGYVTGIEPGTCFPHNRGYERKAGRVPKLKPGETRRFTIDFGIHAGGDEVAKVAKQIDAIQGGRPTHMDREPEKLPGK